MCSSIYSKIALAGICYLVSAMLAYGQGQIGINVDIPTSVLDVNGDMKVRAMPTSTSTSDQVLVVDDDGFVKKSIISSSYFRGYLATDFSSGSASSSVFQITGFTIIDQPANEFDSVNSTFTPIYSGLYNIVLTLTATYTNTITTNNVVYGLVDADSHKWVMRFSVPKNYITGVGQNSAAGVVNSFSGAVELEAGKKYYFGVTDNVKLLSNPSGSTGSGIGSYLSIELVKMHK